MGTDISASAHNGGTRFSGRTAVGCDHLAAQGENISPSPTAYLVGVEEIPYDIGGAMLYEGYIASEVWKMETERVERRAAAKWRFRHLKSRESQLLTVIATNVLQLFLR